MRIGIIVSDFPKVTETFILRDLVYNHDAGHEMRIYHLKPYRKNEVIHGFAEKTLDWSVTLPFLLDRRVVGALLRALIFHPVVLTRIVSTIVREFFREPLTLIGALSIVPKSLAIAEDIKSWEAGHVHAEFAGHPGTAAWIVGRVSMLPYSISCHAHDIFRTQGLLRQKLQEASFVRNISEFNRKFLIDRFPSLASHKMPIIHVGVDTEEIKPLPRFNSDTLQILFVGSMQIRKGISELLRAIAQLPEDLEWKCNLVGGGKQLEELKRLACSLGIQHKVEFHGPQSFEVVSRFMSQSHLLVVPSIQGPGGRAEGIPTVIMEALAHQRPVISTRLTGIPELIKDGETGYLIEPGDIDELTHTIERVNSNPDEAQAMAECGRNLVEREFDLRTNAEARLQLYIQHSADRKVQS